MDFNPHPAPEQTSTLTYLVLLIVFQVVKAAREAWRDKKRHNELVERMEIVEALAKKAAEDSASANRKAWRLTHPGEVTPSPEVKTLQGVLVPPPRRR